MKRLLFVALALAALSVPAYAQSVTRWTPAFEARVTSGTIAAGTHSVTFILSSDFVGSVMGTAVTGANITAPMVYVCQGEHRHPAIAYTRTAGTLWVLSER